MAELLPQDLRPPLLLAAAKAVKSIPRPGAMPEDPLYEPKWDGYRAILTKRAPPCGPGRARTYPGTSRTWRPLPGEYIPAGCVVDGEAVIWTEGRLDFNSLQQWMTTSVTTQPRSFWVMLTACVRQASRNTPKGMRCVQCAVTMSAKEWGASCTADIFGGRRLLTVTHPVRSGAPLSKESPVPRTPAPWLLKNARSCSSRLWIAGAGTRTAVNGQAPGHEPPVLHCAGQAPARHHPEAIQKQALTLFVPIDGGGT